MYSAFLERDKASPATSSSLPEPNYIRLWSGCLSLSAAVDLKQQRRTGLAIGHAIRTPRNSANASDRVRDHGWAQFSAALLASDFHDLKTVTTFLKDNKGEELVRGVDSRMLEAGCIADAADRSKHVVENKRVDLDASDIEDVVSPVEDLQGTALSPSRDIARIKPAAAKRLAGGDRIAHVARGQIRIANPQNSGHAGRRQLAL